MLEMDSYRLFLMYFAKDTLYIHLSIFIILLRLQLTCICLNVETLM